MSENILRLENIRKDFEIGGKTVQVLHDINFNVKKGEIISLIGSSGCGKSTILKLIINLEDQTCGNIYLDDEPVTSPSEKINMIFQEPRLFPWLTVEENIVFTLNKKYNKKEKKEIAKKHIKLVGLSGYEKAYPSQLSGGMQQRVSIARALANDPEVLMLDEPFGALDAFTREKLQEETLNIWKEKNNTMILVTHDIDEAIYLSNRIFVLSPKPGIVKDIIKIDLKHPRDRSSIDFLELRRKVMLSLQNRDKDNVEYYI